MSMMEQLRGKDISSKLVYKALNTDIEEYDIQELKITETTNDKLGEVGKALLELTIHLKNGHNVTLTTIIDNEWG